MPLEPLPAGSEGNPLALVGHLGMSGQMLLRTPGFEPDKLTRVVIHVDDSSGQQVEFRFVDQRIFGSLAIDELVPTIDGLPGGFSPESSSAQEWWTNLIPSSAAHIARDPLDPNFHEAAVLKKLRSKNTGIKRAILDQNLMSGVGNIYADESLWRAKLHYDQSANSLTAAKAKELLIHVREILTKAVEVGGTSFDEQYKNVNGESGYFEISLNAYGRAGSACARCGGEIIRENWANRGSHFCPRCQRRR
jgi:formamidopyrimidine-DNA glycosylase